MVWFTYKTNTMYENHEAINCKHHVCVFIISQYFLYLAIKLALFMALHVSIVDTMETQRPMFGHNTVEKSYNKS